MEIEVGEYVRTNNGYITKMTSEDFIKILLEGKSVFGKLVKHSKNIIDLIEVKDVIEINNEKYEVGYDKSFGKLGVLIPNKEQLAIRHCSLEYIFSKQRNGRVSKYKVSNSRTI